MAQSLELLRIQLLMPDNDARRQAEEQIRRLARDPQVVPALVQHLRTAKTPNVRQLAAVLLRKKIISHWPKLPPHAKAPLKQALIDSITLDHRSLTSHLSSTIPHPLCLLTWYGFYLSLVLVNWFLIYSRLE